MEYRRFFNHLPGRNLGYETLLPPQLEDYEVFRTGFFDHDPIPFQVVLNVACVAPKQLRLSFPEPKILQVRVKHLSKRFENFVFGRDCTLRFVIPDEVDENLLIAKWYEDQYLVINEKKGEDGTGSGDPSPGPSFRDQIRGLKPTKDQIRALKPAKDQIRGLKPAKDQTGGSGSGEDEDGTPKSVDDKKYENGDFPLSTEVEQLSDPNEPENIRVLEPIFEKRKFKAVVDVDKIQNLFAEIADKARLEERYMQNYYFKTANFERKKDFPDFPLEMYKAAEQTLPLKKSVTNTGNCFHGNNSY